MELGEKLRLARLEAGLSQRQLCGETITRNMLSQIEHGTAKPSMDTLRYLAARLEKPVSWFLEEENVVSPNQTVMEEARRFYDLGEFANALTILEGFREPDGVYDREKQLLECLVLLALAEGAVESDRLPYARELLARLNLPEKGCCAGELKKRYLFLMARLDKKNSPRFLSELPGLDSELQLRAEAAMEAGNGDRAARLLEAMEDRETARWKLLRGRSHMLQKKYKSAITCLLAAEKGLPMEAAALLEICYRETEDFRRAYLYACKQKK